MQQLTFFNNKHTKIPPAAILRVQHNNRSVKRTNIVEPIIRLVGLPLQCEKRKVTDAV